MVNFVFSLSLYFLNQEERILSSDALETWCEVFTVISDLEEESWIWHLLGFECILFFFLAVPEPLIQLFFVETSLDDEACKVFLVPVTFIEMIIIDKLSHLLLSLALSSKWLNFFSWCRHISSFIEARSYLLLNNISLNLMSCFISGEGAFVH